jgi:hypothetical protein
MPSRTLDHNTTKRTTACQASKLDKHEEASSSAKSAPLGMKTQATSLESIHRTFCRRRPPPPATAGGGGGGAHHTDHPSPQRMQACLWHAYVGGGGMRATRLLVAYVRQASPPKELLGHLARRQEETCTCLRKHKGLS